MTACGLLTRLLITLLAACAPLAHADLELVTTPPGRFVSLDTHRIYYHCIGSGAPLVVIDAGIGGSALEWTPVQERLSRSTRVCTYDRAGYGWSDPGPSPRTTAQAAAELHQVLERAGERTPAILVGHSLGGFNVRYFATRFPAAVAGLVLVDSSHPRALPHIEPHADGRRHGIDVERVDASLELAAYARAGGFLNTRRKAVFAQMDELAHFAESAAQVAAAGSLPAVPLVVISRDALAGADPGREARWAELQRSLAALNERGRLVVAAGSGHDVHLSRPDVIVAEVERLLAERVAGRRATAAPDQGGSVMR